MARDASRLGEIVVTSWVAAQASAQLCPFVATQRIWGSREIRDGFRIGLSTALVDRDTQCVVAFLRP